jgi:hypothetical protein
LSKQKKKNLFDYWDHLKPIRLLPQQTFDKTKQEVRKAIAKALLLGIEDIYPGTDEKRKRHVLNAEEIRREVNKNLVDTVQKANLYFHLNELEKLEIVQVVEAISIDGSKRYTSFYGRTAKIYLLDTPKDKKEYKILDTPEFLSFLKEINPNLTEDKYNQVYELLDNINNFDHKPFISWFEKYNSQISSLDLDLTELHGLISFIKRFDANVFKGFAELAKLLDFD